MIGDQPVSWLMFFTLASAIIVAARAFIYFLRSEHNRDIAATALVKKGSAGRVTPQGAFPELGGIAAVMVVAMGLLAAGYMQRSHFERRLFTAQTSGGGMAQPVGIADKPKVYQPANPQSDTRSAPTSSDTGTGSANGSTGKPK